MTVGEWDERQLCPDGGCVGVIGPEGTCTVCGRVAPNWGDERTRGLIAPEEGDDDGDDVADDDEEAADDGDDAAAETEARAEPTESDWPERELCSDGACIGVIGADGRCKVCGKPGTSPRADASIEAPADAPTDAPIEPSIDAAAPDAPDLPVNSTDSEPKS